MCWGAWAKDRGGVGESLEITEGTEVVHVCMDPAPNEVSISLVWSLLSTWEKQEVQRGSLRRSNCGSSLAECRRSCRRVEACRPRLPVRWVWSEAAPPESNVVSVPPLL